MLLKTIFFLFFSLSAFAAKANPLLDLKVINKVHIQTILEFFETSLIPDIQGSQKIAACMKIAEAKNSAENLSRIYLLDPNLFKKNSQVLYVTASLELAADASCKALDKMEVDENFIKRISRHLNNARMGLPNI